jgi:hypothetical protein
MIGAMPTECPFRIGDQLRFVPDVHAEGWSWPNFERVRLKPEDTGTVTRIEKGQFIFLDDNRGGFHWECFRKEE